MANRISFWRKAKFDIQLNCNNLVSCTVTCHRVGLSLWSDLKKMNRRGNNSIKNSFTESNLLFRIDYIFMIGIKTSVIGIFRFEETKV